MRLRRPVVPSATSRRPPTVAAAPGIGTRPSAWASRPPTVSTSSAGSSTSKISPRSSIGSRAVTRTEPSAQALDRRTLDVVLVGDLADDLLEDVLDGDQAGGAAVLVDHDHQVRAGGLHLGQQVVDRLGLRTKVASRISSTTGTASAGGRRSGCAGRRP